MTLTELNLQLFRAINNLGKEYSFFNPVIIFIAENMIYLLALSVIIFLLTRRKRNQLMVVCAIISLIIAEIFGKIAGQFHTNYQPFVEVSNVNQLIEVGVNNSFPSDHTIIFFSVCVTFWLFYKRIGLFWVGLALLVGFSRIWVGVHYPGDIIVGAVLGAISAVFVWKVLPRTKLINKIMKINENEQPIQTKKAQ